MGRLGGRCPRSLAIGDQEEDFRERGRGLGGREIYLGTVRTGGVSVEKTSPTGFWKRPFRLITATGQKNNEDFLFETYFELIYIISS